MDIGELTCKMDIAIEILEDLESILINGIFISKQSLTFMLGNGVLEVIPDLIELYGVGSVEERYWEQQFERIMSAIEGEDMFFLIDVLMNETKVNFFQCRENIA